ncbi:MAG: hypothetical protein AAF533_06115 [Acidobacteriota bacterium]
MLARRQLVITVLVALAVVGGGELVVRWLEGPKAWAFESTRTGTIVGSLAGEGRLPEDGEPWDVLFFGNSVCAVNVAPTEFAAAWQEATGSSLDGFNVGIDGLYLPATDNLHENVLAPRVPHRRLVLLLAPPSFQDGAQPLHVDSSGALLLSGRAPWGEVLVSRLELRRHRTQWRSASWVKSVLRTRDTRGDLDVRQGPSGRGWQPVDYQLSQEQLTVLADDVRTTFPEGWQVPESSERALSRIAEREQASGRELVVVLTPLPPRFLEAVARPEELLAEVTAAVQRAAPEATVLDLHAPSGFGDDDFSDLIHLRPESARRFSGLLARRLADDDGFRLGLEPARDARKPPRSSRFRGASRPSSGWSARPGG